MHRVEATVYAVGHNALSLVWFYSLLKQNQNLILKLKTIIMTVLVH